MARFSAITSDSGESEDERRSESHSSEEEDVLVHEEEPESEGSVSAEEEEPLPSPPRKKQPHVEDEDEDVRQVELVDATAGPSKPRGDPTLIRRAQQIGMDAQRMHVMQTSFFRMPEEAAALRAMNRPTRAQIQITARTLRRKHRRDSDGDGLRFDLREVRARRAR
jgi:nuclear pore complex protein Nup98-Nup96